ncbi:hypothetical protein [Acinetobacter sp. YH16051]|uniref:hypothetical protein n=1 Tax=Acinetobacter sp. YH16051 TaxID=2601190 RepID=UPI0015D18F08|nr:hypothetical protein [Acinetobacter sp. YH16051]
MLNRPSEEKEHNFIKISKLDMYDLLRNRFYVRSADLQMGGWRKEILFFQETFSVIQNYDVWLSTLQYAYVIKANEYSELKVLQQPDVEKATLSLCYKSELLPECWGLEIPVFRVFLELLKLAENEVNLETQRSLLSLFKDVGRGKKLLDVPKEAVEGTINSYINIHKKIQPLVIDQSPLSEIFQSTYDEEKFFNYYNGCLDELGSVYVLCLDIRLYIPSARDQYNYEDVFHQFKDQISKIYELIDGTEDLLSCVSRLEPMQEVGLNLHCVLMFDGRTPISPDGIISQLEKKIKQQIFPFNFKIINWNTTLSRFMSSKAVGEIKKKNNKSRYDCWYWVYSYVFSVDQVIGFKFKNSFQSLRISCSHIVSSRFFVSGRWEKMVSSVNPPKMFEVAGLIKADKAFSRSHLPPVSKQYLDIVDLKYLLYMRLNLPTLELVSYLSKSSVESRIVEVEVFCETLKMDSPELFYSSLVFGEDVSASLYFKSLSRIGRMWFSFFNPLSVFKEPLFTVDQLLKSDNCQKFTAFFKKYQEELEHLANQPITSDTIRRTEKILAELKTSLDVEAHIKNFKKMQSKFEEHCEYFDYLLAKDVLVTRMHLCFTSPERILDKQEQAKILTEFLRVGRSAKPLRWLRGYILRWDEKYDKSLYADLTLFFEYGEKLQNQNIHEDVKSYLDSFVAKCNNELQSKKPVQPNEVETEKTIAKKEKKPILGEGVEIRYELEIQEISNKVAELLKIPLKIEAGNNPVKVAFTKLYLPYIYYLSLFLPLQKDEKKIKRFTTGRIPRAELKSSNKKLEPQEVEELELQETEELEHKQTQVADDPNNQALDGK